jgi:hypothetical protein
MYCHDIGYVGCPSGATQFCDTMPIVGTSASQASLACNTCWGAAIAGAPCDYDASDCSGPSYTPHVLIFCALGDLLPRWTYGVATCQPPGTVDDWCTPTMVYGHWAN